MKNLSAMALAVITAGPALAHGGAHLHPHGSEIWLALLPAAALLGAVVLLGMRRK